MSASKSNIKTAYEKKVLVQLQPTHLESDEKIIAEYLEKLDIPKWYRGISEFQMIAADELLNNIRDDMEQDTTHRVRGCLLSIGIKPIVDDNKLRAVANLSRGNDLAFLYFLYEMCYKTNGHKYSLNEQLILSVIAHLDMVSTLRELDRILPPRQPTKLEIERAKHEEMLKNKTKKKVVKVRKLKFERHKRLAPYFQKMQPPKMYSLPLTVKRLPLKVSLGFYNIWNDLNYIVPNEFNRWFASYNFQHSSRFATRVIKEQIMKSVQINELTDRSEIYFHKMRNWQPWFTRYDPQKDYRASKLIDTELKKLIDKHIFDHMNPRPNNIADGGSYCSHHQYIREIEHRKQLEKAVEQKNRCERHFDVYRKRREASRKRVLDQLDKDIREYECRFLKAYEKGKPNRNVVHLAVCDCDGRDVLIDDGRKDCQHTQSDTPGAPKGVCAEDRGRNIQDDCKSDYGLCMTTVRLLGGCDRNPEQQSRDSDKSKERSTSTSNKHILWWDEVPPPADHEDRTRSSSTRASKKISPSTTTIHSHSNGNKNFEHCSSQSSYSLLSETSKFNLFSNPIECKTCGGTKFDNDPPTFSSSSSINVDECFETSEAFEDNSDDKQKHYWWNHMPFWENYLDDIVRQYADNPKDVNDSKYIKKIFKWDGIPSLADYVEILKLQSDYLKTSWENTTIPIEHIDEIIWKSPKYHAQGNEKNNEVNDESPTDDESSSIDLICPKCNSVQDENGYKRLIAGQDSSTNFRKHDSTTLYRSANANRPSCWGGIQWIGDSRSRCRVGDLPPDKPPPDCKELARKKLKEEAEKNLLIKAPRATRFRPSIMMLRRSLTERAIKTEMHNRLSVINNDGTLGDKSRIERDNLRLKMGIYKQRRKKFKLKCDCKCPPPKPQEPIFFRSAGPHQPYQFFYNEIFDMEKNVPTVRNRIGRIVEEKEEEELDLKKMILGALLCGDCAKHEGAPTTIDGAIKQYIRNVFKKGTVMGTRQINKQLRYNKLLEESNPLKLKYTQSYFDPDDEQLMRNMLKDAIIFMRRNPRFILASIDESYKMPILREWIYERYGKQYDMNERRNYYRRALKFFKALDRSVLAVKLLDPQHVTRRQKICYACAEYFQNKAKQFRKEFYETLDNILMDQTRAFWFAINAFLWSSGPPRNTFFAYMPARTNDINHFGIWQPHQFMNAKAEWESRRCKKIKLNQEYVSIF